MELLERILGLLTAHTWVSSRQSYRLNGPPGSYSSAEVSMSRGRMVPIGAAEEEQEALDDEVEQACRKRLPRVMHTLTEMVEESE